MAKINVKDNEITIISVENKDYISLTDMANTKENESRAADIIKNWIRTRYTLEFLGTWEQINNPNFKVVEFDHFKTQAGLPSFVLSVSEWIEKPNAVGMFEPEFIGKMNFYLSATDMLLKTKQDSPLILKTMPKKQAQILHFDLCEKREEKYD